MSNRKSTVAFAIAITALSYGQANAESGTFQFYGQPLSYNLPDGLCSLDRQKSVFEALLLGQMEALYEPEQKLLFSAIPCSERDRVRDPNNDFLEFQTEKWLLIWTGNKIALLDMGRSEYLEKVYEIIRAYETNELKNAVNDKYESSDFLSKLEISSFEGVGDIRMTNNAVYQNTVSEIIDDQPYQVNAVIASTLVRSHEMFVGLYSEERPHAELQAVMFPFVDDLVIQNGTASDLREPSLFERIDRWGGAVAGAIKGAIAGMIIFGIIGLFRRLRGGSSKSR